MWEPKAEPNPDKQQAEKTKLENLDKSCENCGNVCSINNSVCIKCHAVWEKTGELKAWKETPEKAQGPRRRFIPTAYVKDFMAKPASDFVPPYPVGFTRIMLKDHMESCCKEIVELFSAKNIDYGQGDDAFANFRAAGERVLRPVMPTATTEELMWLSAFIYVQKHIQALEHTGMDGKEADSRLQDIAVYCLIMRAILKQSKEQCDE